MDTLKKYCLELAIRATQVTPSAASTAAAASNIVGVAQLFEDYLTSDVQEKSEQSTLRISSFKEFLDYLDKMK